MWFLKSISYGRNDCKVIDSGVFGSNETIFIACHSGISCFKEFSMLQVCHSEASAEESTWLHVRILSPVWTTFHEEVQQSYVLLGQEHPPHHHTYLTVSIIFSLYFEVVEKYFKADSSNPGEKLSMLSILSPHEWM